MGQARADKVVLVEDGNVFNLVFEVQQDGILDKLSLQERLLVNWTVKEALVAQIPKEIGRVVLQEEVLLEIASKVCHLISEEVHGLLLSVVIHCHAQLAMEECQEAVVLLQHLVKDLGVFLSEITVLELRVGYSLAVFVAFLSVVDTVETVWVLDHNIEPNVRLDLTQDVRVCARCDALNRCIKL